MKHVLGLMLVLPLLLVACRPPTTADLETELCENLDQLGTALADLSQINAQSSINDLRSARNTVAVAFEEVQAAAAAVESSRIDDLQTAYADFDSTVMNISGRETVGEAVGQIAAAQQNLQSAREQVDADISCD